MKTPAIHYESAYGNTACGICCDQPPVIVTTKKHVTCGNCKRTCAFKERS